MLTGALLLTCGLRWPSSRTTYEEVRASGFGLDRAQTKLNTRREGGRACEVQSVSRHAWMLCRAM